ncbi:MAG TPA: hypothetical protein VGX78_19410, partial [Pirellulales bacterium]|nr:hypothetical protein [Pirellulales bacterium]
MAAPNVWAKVPVLEASVDLFSGSPHRSPGLAAFFQQLGEWLPQLASRHALPALNCECDRGCVAFALGQSLCAVTLELQELAYKPVRFGR